MEGAWARIAGQRCWAEQIEIAGNAITYQPPGPGQGPLRHTTFVRTDPPAGSGDGIVLTLADGGRAALRMIDASHISDRQGCRYQRDD